MVLKRFKTDWRLWLCVSLALFAIPWFIPTLLGKDTMRPIVLFFSDPDDMGIARFLIIGIGTLFFGVPAVLVGWVLQAIVVSFRDWKKTE